MDMNNINVKKVTFDEAVDIQCERFTNLATEEIVVEQDNNHQILIDDYLIVLPELGIAIGDATFCNYDEEYDEFYADWAGTALFSIEADGFHYTMMEQDGMITTLSNQGFNIDNIYNQNKYVLSKVESLIFSSDSDSDSDADTDFELELTKESEDDEELELDF